MIITYELGQSLYINITNRCSNCCTFCIRDKADGVGDGIDLWLEREPTVAEIVADIEQRDVSRYKELVFCGYGEPLMRAVEVIEIGKILKNKFAATPIRINTNGQANLIYGKDITPQLQGLVDYISISLNAKNGQAYQALCQSEYGEKAFAAILDFAVKCKQYIPKVVLTVVDVLPAEDIEACREIARRIGVDFRVRHYAK